MKRLWLLVLPVIALLLVACGPRPIPLQTISVEGGSYKSVAAAGLQEMLKRKDFLLVNVHIPTGSSIAGTDVSIPYDQIGSQLSFLPADKSRKIVLYCRSGRMSAIGAEALVKLGYSNVWDLDGGTQAWEAAGFPLETK